MTSTGTRPPGALPPAGADGGWHPPDDLLARYARDPRRIGTVTASSIESHLPACARCRAAVAAAAPVAPTLESWAEVVDRIDRPRRHPVERLLGSLGVGDGLARLVAATPALQLGWLASVAAIVGLVVVVAHQRDSHTLYLLLAPVLPLGAVAVGFAPGIEPGGEAAFAAPLSGTALLLRRAVAVLVASFVAVAVGAAALPGVEATDAAWVLPALALVAVALALGTWWPVEHAAPAVAAAWVLVLGFERSLLGGSGVADLAPFVAAGQGASLVLAVAAGAVAWTRRDRLVGIGGTSWT